MNKLDKNLIAKRFKKSLTTYSENAVVQKHMTQRLGEFIQNIPVDSTGSVLEIGCGTGFLTEYLSQNLRYERYVANDIIPECADYVEMISDEIEFLEGDVDELKIDEKFNLIVSNATLQWSHNLPRVIKNLNGMLSDNGILAFSIFGEKNLEQMSKLVSRALNYHSLDDLKVMLKDYKVLLMRDELIKLNFENPVDVLKHIKFTGTNAISEYRWSKSGLKNFESQYKRFYTSSEGVYLTYHPIYVILEKTDF